MSNIALSDRVKSKVPTLVSAFCFAEKIIQFICFLNPKGKPLVSELVAVQVFLLIKATRFSIFQVFEMCKSQTVTFPNEESSGSILLIERIVETLVRLDVHPG